MSLQSQKADIIVKIKRLQAANRKLLVSQANIAAIFASTLSVTSQTENWKGPSRNKFNEIAASYNKHTVSYSKHAIIDFFKASGNKIKQLEKKLIAIQLEIKKQDD